ncbi:MAG TPA: RluA family pseudouridine synthase [Saprospiraceae bacterium]|nr:RluA family pseudouridine synthase [Saprospiraceae bacterium]HQW55528.1 RluA family pseudouridine synthase [Saprospiraceae bacterium]
MLKTDEELDDLLPDGRGDDLYEHYSFLVDNGQSPVRIDKFVFDRVQQISRNKIQVAIRAGNVLVNSVPVKPNYRVRPKDEISIVLPHPPAENTGVLPEDIPLNIIYEDDDVMVLNKPTGMVVHPGLGNKSGTLVNALAHYFKYNLPVKAGNDADRPGLVHRIDKNTSGLLLIAKNEYAMTHLAKQFFDHTVEREYNALVWGEIEPEAGKIENNLARNPNNRMQMMVFDESDIGKKAITNYKTLERFYYTSLVSCRLETGRTHQIRAHMMALGHPVFNDDRYGGEKILKGTIFTKYRQFVENCFSICPRQALHARTLGFTHPTTGKAMFFDCPIPEDMTLLLDKWRNYLQTRREIPEED